MSLMPIPACPFDQNKTATSQEQVMWQFLSNFLHHHS
jgi:hypothetical protein